MEVNCQDAHYEVLCIGLHLPLELYCFSLALLSRLFRFDGLLGQFNDLSIPEAPLDVGRVLIGKLKNLVLDDVAQVVNYHLLVQIDFAIGVQLLCLSE